MSSKMLSTVFSFFSFNKLRLRFGMRGATLLALICIVHGGWFDKAATNRRGKADVKAGLSFKVIKQELIDKIKENKQGNMEVLIHQK